MSLGGNTAAETAPESPDQAAVKRYSILSIGDLTTNTAAADLLECALSLAEAEPGRLFGISWIGDGVLRGLLKAQPLPDTVSQRFLGNLTEAEAAREVAGADVLCLIGAGRGLPQLTAAVRSAGIPVIGCSGNETARHLIRSGHTGWQFEFRRPATIMAALRHALEADARAAANVSTIALGAAAE